MFEPGHIVTLLALVTLYRVLLLRRRWSLPLAYGPDHFMGIQVGPAFSGGPGRALLQTWRWALVAPLVVEVAAFVGFVAAGNLERAAAVPFVGLLLSLASIRVMGFVLTRVAGHHAISRPDQPSTAISIELRPRTLRQYSNQVIEAAFLLAGIVCVLAAAGDRPQSPGFAPLVGAAFVHGWLVLLKLAVIRWRTPLPGEHAETYVKQREELRRFLLGICDWCRSFTVLWALWMVIHGAWPANVIALVMVLVSLSLVVFCVVWLMRSLEQVVALLATMPPVRLPRTISSYERPGPAAERSAS